MIRETACEHPFWRYPNPIPEHGSECAICGAIYRRPASHDRYTERELWHIRAYYEMLALWFRVNDPEDPLTNHRPQEAFGERSRIARRTDWIQPGSVAGR